VTRFSMRAKNSSSVTRAWAVYGLPSFGEEGSGEVVRMGVSSLPRRMGVDQSGEPKTWVESERYPLLLPLREPLPRPDGELDVGVEEPEGRWKGTGEHSEVTTVGMRGGGVERRWTGLDGEETAYRS
jgi:hypothetical protein